MTTAIIHTMGAYASAVPAAALPPAIPVGAVHHYDLSLGDYTVSSGDITVIPDQAGSNNLVSSAGGKFPADGRTMNGLAVADFQLSNAENIYGPSLDSHFLATDAPYTIAVVVDLDDAGITSHIVAFNATSGNAYYSHVSKFGEWRSQKRDTAALFAGPTGGNPQVGGRVVLWVHTGTTVSIYVNGVLELNAGVSDVDLMTDTTRLSVGGWNSSGSTISSPLEGAIGEIAIYDTALSAGDIDDLSTFLVEKWLQGSDYLSYVPVGYTSTSNVVTNGGSNRPYFFAFGPVLTGKKYWEFDRGNPYAGNATDSYLGIYGADAALANYSVNLANTGLPASDDGFGWRADGNVYNDSTLTTGHITFNGNLNDERMMFAYDATAEKIWIGVNGTWQGDPSAGTGGFSVSHWASAAGGVRVGLCCRQAGVAFEIKVTSGTLDYTIPTGFSALT